MQRKGPLPGKICAWCILQRRFAGLFGYMARESCQSQLVLDAWRRYAAREGRFSRPRPLRERIRAQSCHSKGARGCIASTYCHCQTLRNAFREHLAVAEQSKAHLERTLPWHRPPWNASRIRIAMPGRLRTNRSRILPTKPLFSCARVQDARSRHGASQTRGLRRACAACRAQGGIGVRGLSGRSSVTGHGTVGRGHARSRGGAVGSGRHRLRG